MTLDRVFTKPEADQIDAVILIPVIKEAVIEAFHIEGSLLHGRQRDGITALARQVIMYLIRQHTDLPLEKIGNELGGRTPATISWGYQRIAVSLEKNSSLRLVIEQIENMVREALRNE